MPLTLKDKDRISEGDKRAPKNISFKLPAYWKAEYLDIPWDSIGLYKKLQLAFGKKPFSYYDILYELCFDKDGIQSKMYSIIKMEKALWPLFDHYLLEYNSEEDCIKESSYANQIISKP